MEVALLKTSKLCGLEYLPPNLLVILLQGLGRKKISPEKGNTFQEISIFGHVTVFHLVSMAFRITKYHMFIRKLWWSQFSDAFQDIIMRYGTLLNLCPSKAIQSFGKRIQK